MTMACRKAYPTTIQPYGRSRLDSQFMRCNRGTLIMVLPDDGGSLVLVCPE